MHGYRPTSEQAEHIRQAIAAATLVNPERAQELQALEGLGKHTGDGIPEEVMEHLLPVILGRKEPRHIDELLDKLFGNQPEGMFEAIGQFAAISSLAEYLALDLLSMLIDETPREKYEKDLSLQQWPNKVLDLCEERAASLGPELRAEVLRAVKNMRQLRQWRNQYVHTTWSRYAGGWRWPRKGGPGLLITEEEQGVNLPNLAEEAAQAVMWLRDLIQECQAEKNRRLSR